MLRPYRLLAKVPRAPSLMILGLLGRLHMPAIPIVLTFLVVGWTGSYLTGGLVGAVLVVGQAVSGPLRGRAADRRSRPKVLLATAIPHGAGLVAMALIAHPAVLPPSAWWVLLPVAAIVGLCQPPVAPVGRMIWAEVADGEARNAAYAVEATLQELLFVIAPVLAAATVGLAGAAAATFACAVVAVAGSASFAVVLARAGLSRAVAASGPVAPGNVGALLRVPGFPALLLFGLLITAGLTTTDLVMVGWSRDQGKPELAGILAAVWAVGSMIGGLALGASSRTPKLWLRGLAAAAGLLALLPALLPLVHTGSPLIVCAILFVGGAAIAPTLSTCNASLSTLITPGRRAEAFGWFATASLAGATVASPIAGVLLDMGGPGIAAGVAGLLAAFGALFVVRPGSLSGVAPAIQPL